MLQRVEVGAGNIKMFVIQFSIGWVAACGQDRQMQRVRELTESFIGDGERWKQGWVRCKLEMLDIPYSEAKDDSGDEG